MTHDPTDHDLPATLRLQLRGLRRDEPPARDLWPDLSARLAVEPRQPPVRPAARPRALPALAAAAVLALALGLGWQLRPDTAVPVPVEAPAPTPAAAPGAAPADAPRTPAPLVVQADAMAREYEGALRELTAARPPVAGHPALIELDRSADDVRQALAHDPDAVFLLQRLQRVYAQRLSLTQRLARA
ncbi:hypothetical protein [Luteimonas kalidii]|uniref:Uncharacterized protein n=1 Tax=Luteimonas kalidii TaxID=3042025 RepID=A0ABT6JVB9_9GAMM|nr:hypothetical protein [Luteimonas kalidii]MDH5833901.1 hypothetical protein [Luteimonas kalidii]